MGTVIPMWRPRSFTSSEELIESVQEMIHLDKRTYKTIAEATGVNASTVNNLAIGKTRWPRQTTLFPLLGALGYELRVEKKG